MIRLATILLAAVAAFAVPQDLSDEEQIHLRQVLAGGSSTPADLIRALETHLAKFPHSPKKAELERALAKSAIQAKDQKRIAQYGPLALKSQPDDLSMLEPVVRTLVSIKDPESAKSGLAMAKRYEEIVRAMAKEPVEGSDRARKKTEIDRMLGQAILYQAVASDSLGDYKTAVELARKSFDVYPSGEPAAQTGKSLGQLGQFEDAARAYADAFTVPDARGTDADRAVVRRRMGEMYQRAHGNETGLGDVLLKAYDRNAALMAERRLALKEFDPNMDLTNPLEFTLAGLNGDKLKLMSLAGKIIVMDFWATWCGPCRAQHPLYEKIKKNFANQPEVVFLSITTDEDRSAVKPFLEEIGWSQKVYFEDGLSRNLRVSSIPTTIIFNRRGEVAMRMNGYDPAQFVDDVTRRIKEALQE